MKRVFPLDPLSQKETACGFAAGTGTEKREYKRPPEGGQILSDSKFCTITLHVELYRFPDLPCGKSRSRRRSVRAILGIHFQIRVALHIIPPFFPNRRNQRSCFLCRKSVYLVHIRLLLGLVMPGPRFIKNRPASRLSNPLTKLCYGSKEFFFGCKGMRMLLQNHIIIAPIQDIKAHLLFLCMLCQMPATMCKHGNAAIKTRFFCTLADKKRHIVIVGMAIADK